jgi:hypothetical protein
MAAYLLAYEEAVRGTPPGSPVYMALPITEKPKPSVKPKDEARAIFNGVNTALGYSTVVRRDLEWSHTITLPWFCGAETDLLLKHAFGWAGTRATLDTTARKGIFYPVAMPFGPGSTLGTKAIGLVAHEDVNGVTKSQVFGGGRIKSLSIIFKATDDIKLQFEIGGDGLYIGAPGQDAITSATFPINDPFMATTAGATFYTGSGAVRTGVAPDFTDLGVGTMIQFIPEDCTIKWTFGVEDSKPIGPRKSKRSGQVKLEVDISIDYEAPTTGWNIKGQVDAIVTAATTNALMILLNNGQLAGSATENYKAIIDIPKGLASVTTPDITNDGKTPSAKLKWTSLMGDTTQYPVAIITQNKNATV